MKPSLKDDSGASATPKQAKQPSVSKSIPPFTFHDWTERHGSMSSYVEISRYSVLEKLKYDKDFLNLKLYEIKVKSWTNQSTMGGYTAYNSVGWAVTNTERHWCKNITEAKQLGQVIKQVYPRLSQRPASDRKPKKGSA